MISVDDIRNISDVVKEKPTKTYAIDIDNGNIIGYIDGIEAVEQYIRKALITPRYKCSAYTSEYGSAIETTVVMNKHNRELIKALLPNIIKDTLSDSRIIDVYDFEFEDGADCIYINFTVDTVYGTTNIEEAIPNV